MEGTMTMKLPPLPTNR